MSLIKKAAILLFVLLGIPIGVVFLRPDLVLSTLAKSTAAQLGYEISSMTVSHLGLNSLNIEELSLLSADQGLQFRDILVEYSLSDLLSAQVQSLHVS